MPSVTMLREAIRANKRAVAEAHASSDKLPSEKWQNHHDYLRVRLEKMLAKALIANKGCRR